MQRFHYCFAADFLSPPPPYLFDNKDLDKAAGGFYLNLLRIQSLARLPIMLTGAAIVTKTYDMLAISQLGIEVSEVELIAGRSKLNPNKYAEKEALRIEM